MVKQRHAASRATIINLHFFLLVPVLTGFNYMQISNEDIKVPLLANLYPRLGRNYIRLAVCGI